MKRLVIAVLMVGCTGTAPSGGGPKDAAHVEHDAPTQHDAPATGGGFVLTSPSLTEGGNFVAANTCDGANDSPALAWDSAPLGTQGYALVLTDTTISLTHAVIYDIPPTADGLPAALAKVYA